MSKTHTGTLVNEAKKLSRWLVERAKSAGRPTTEAEINTRVMARCGMYTDEDRTSITQAGLVFFKRDDPDGYARVIAAYCGEKVS